MSHFNINAIEAKGAELSANFGGQYDPELIEQLSFYVLGSKTPEVHTLDVMASGLSFITQELYPPNRARAVSDTLLGDEDFCRAIITAKQQF